MKWSYLITATLFLLMSLKVFAQNYPGKHWEQYVDPAQAGFSVEKLQELEKTLIEEGSAAFLIIQDGKIVFNWGDTNRRFRQASIRKSYLNAVFGIYRQKQDWDLNETIADLGIDDLHPLTQAEKQARLIDLLSARSGVYHPSAYNTRSNADNLPERGSHPAGSFWYYNNWDFNVLLSVFKQKSGKDLFQAFQKHIALPLKMEDFRLFDTYYRYEPEVSQHPAYLFKMTARDMARFGWLMLNEGRWNNRQIVPKEWVKRSTQAVTENLGPRFEPYGAYGLLWWISDGIDGRPMYYASGAGGQRICIFPEDRLVVVHLTDTYQNRDIPQATITQIMTMALQSKERPAIDNAAFQAASYPDIQYPRETIAEELVPLIEGNYRHPALGNFEIRLEKQAWLMQAGIGRFHLFPQSDRQFIIEDMMMPMRFQKGDPEQRNRMEVRMTEDKSAIAEVIFYY
jgi:CubicO group peptidase (beta-lactamase class C family)